MAYRDELDALRASKDALEQRVRELESEAEHREAALSERDEALSQLRSRLQRDEAARLPVAASFEGRLSPPKRELAGVVGAMLIGIGLLAFEPQLRVLAWLLVLGALAWALRRWRVPRIDLRQDGIAVRLWNGKRRSFGWSDVEQARVVTHGDLTELRIETKGAAVRFELGAIDEPERLEQALRSRLEHRNERRTS